MDSNSSRYIYGNSKISLRYKSQEKKTEVALAVVEIRTLYTSEREICVQKIQICVPLTGMEKQMTHFKSTFTTGDSAN